MKDAKSEAQKEIEDYRSQKESEFKTFESEVSRTRLSWLGSYSGERCWRE